MYVNDKIMWIGRARPAPYISKKCLSVILMGRPGEVCFGSMCLLDFLRFISDRTDSNADSTLDVSRADVSMYIIPFSSVNKTNGAWWMGKARELALSNAIPMPEQRVEGGGLETHRQIPRLLRRE